MVDNLVTLSLKRISAFASHVREIAYARVKINNFAATLSAWSGSLVKSSGEYIVGQWLLAMSWQSSCILLHSSRTALEYTLTHTHIYRGGGNCIRAMRSQCILRTVKSVN